MIRGRVIRGLAVGRTIGYPTANIAVTPAATKLKTGVYAAWTLHAEKKYASALVIQTTPAKVEVHLLDYEGEEFYGSTITVDPVQKVSEIEQMDAKDLMAKIDRDIAMVKDVLGGENT